MTPVKRDISISVVICAYTEERWYDLVAAVESIQQQSAPPCEIIVVIDHNTQLFERARVHIPGVVVIESTEPKGLSGARNSGLAMTRGALIAFLDDDAIAEPGWLGRLSNCCQDPQVLGAGGIVEPLWSNKCPAWFPKEFYWVVGCTYQDPPVWPTVVRNPYGGCTCIRREVFEMVGGFRNGIGRVGAYPMGGEETELCIRAAKRWPRKIFLFDPDARIYHRISPYRASWRYFLSRCYAEGLSKAVITRYVGIKDGLSSERTYTCQTLPLGFSRGIADALFRFDLTGFLRAGAIVVGLVLTTTGYLAGIIAQCLALSKGARTGSNSPFQTITTPKITGS
jgi:glucosyl-dolichyl phosphate glucuronosyltransferase